MCSLIKGELNLQTLGVFIILQIHCLVQNFPSCCCFFWGGFWKQGATSQNLAQTSTRPPVSLSSPEADDLAQYLDHLLAHAAKKPKRPTGGLGRFKAVAAKTKEMVALKNKAQELNIQSEYIHYFFYNSLLLIFGAHRLSLVVQTSTCTCRTSCFAPLSLCST